MAVIDMAFLCLLWCCYRSAQALRRPFSVAREDPDKSCQQTAKPTAVRSIEFVTAAHNQPRNDKPADDFTAYGMTSEQQIFSLCMTKHRPGAPAMAGIRQ
ncbi:hypothetical protein [Variovorax ginsengisoli]|uniref:Secreted protein n=1 Tax=Variovorax ginsengisoli TaxID=363844 RepID=A0ABT8SC03_9BURK|nr:hypothetical protein [Variovorax ginsengisoli]MDN8616649.1 hypothetical protein [Variovorax ginsengisoli]MDO1535819.1 hypothetical protein [Variovorax ginsengisoli]